MSSVFTTPVKACLLEAVTSFMFVNVFTAIYLFAYVLKLSEAKPKVLIFFFYNIEHPGVVHLLMRLYLFSFLYFYEIGSQ